VWIQFVIDQPWPLDGDRDHDKKCDPDRAADK